MPTMHSAKWLAVLGEVVRYAEAWLLSGGLAGIESTEGIGVDSVELLQVLVVGNPARVAELLAVAKVHDTRSLHEAVRALRGGVIL